MLIYALCEPLTDSRKWQQTLWAFTLKALDLLSPVSRPLKHECTLS